jgi:hypothetical protein
VHPGNKTVSSGIVKTEPSSVTCQLGVSVSVGVFLVYAGKSRAEAEEDIDRMRVKGESEYGSGQGIPLLGFHSRLLSTASGAVEADS